MWHWRSGVEVWNVESGESGRRDHGRRDNRPSLPGDNEVTFDAGQFGIVRFPEVALSFDGAGTGLDLTVVQTLIAAHGTEYNRSLGTQWSPSDDDLTESACQIAGRDLTEQEWVKYIGASVPYRPTCPTA